MLTKRVDYPLGNAFNPVSDQQLEGKFNALVVPELGEAGAQKILAAGWKLDEAKNLSELMKLRENAEAERSSWKLYRKRGCRRLRINEPVRCKDADNARIIES